MKRGMESWSWAKARAGNNSNIRAMRFIENKRTRYGFVRGEVNAHFEACASRTIFPLSTFTKTKPKHP